MMRNASSCIVSQIHKTVRRAGLLHPHRHNTTAVAAATAASTLSTNDDCCYRCEHFLNYAAVLLLFRYCDAAVMLLFYCCSVAVLAVLCLIMFKVNLYCAICYTRFLCDFCILAFDFVLHFIFYLFLFFVKKNVGRH